MRIFNIFKKKKQVPKWANFFNDKEYSNFIGCVDKYFDRKAVIYEKEGYI